MTDEEFRELQEEAALIAEMADTPGWTLLVRRLNKMLFNRQREMVQGTCKTFEEYKAACAWMSGAQTIVEIPEEVAAALNREVEARTEQRDS